jgi:hypothetical protein
MNQVLIAFVFGGVFVVALIILAIAFPRPTSFQYTIFRSVMALAASGVAAMVPGFLTVDISEATKVAIRAGGALAVFVVVYFFNPARLALQPQDGPQIDLTKPPNPPKQLRDGTPVDSCDAFFDTWNSLVEVERAATALWEDLTDGNLQHFAALSMTAKRSIQRNALLFSQQDYEALVSIMEVADYFERGKVSLAEMRRHAVINGLAVRIDEERQIQQNKRWLTRYRNLLAAIRSSFHEGVKGRPVSR